MNIFRKTYDSNLYVNTLPKDLNSIGFNYLNGKSINPNHSWYEAFEPADNIAQKVFEKGVKWKYDSNILNLNSISHLFIYSLYGNSSFFKTGGAFPANDTTATSPSRIFAANITSSTDGLKTIFIPLINNGFILLNSLGNVQNNFPITPEILSYHEAKNKTLTYSMLIGFKSQIYTNNPYTYIYRCFSSRYDDPYEDPSNTSDYGLYLSFKQNNRGDSYNTIDENKTHLTTYIDKTQNLLYTDVNTNICTLVKMPVFSTYLDNVFICTTSPFIDGIEGKTFSFGGRNFIGLYNNLALELPKN